MKANQSPKRNFGRAPCHGCGEGVRVKVNGNNTLSYNCDECDFAPYFQAGKRCHADFLKKITQDAAPVADLEGKGKPAAKGAPKDKEPEPAAPATEKKSALFGIPG